MGDPVEERSAATVTLLLGDIEDSSGRWQADESAAAAAFDEFDCVVDDIVAKHNGTRPVEQGEGDSFVASFGSATDAVRAALALQHHYGGDGLRVRLALHTGEPHQLGGGRIGGGAVIRCARLRDLANGGQTVMSAATREIVVDTLPASSELVSRGQYTLRGLARAEHVWELHDEGLARIAAPLRAVVDQPGNLPSELDRFVGRASELTDIAALLGRERMITLTGAGGCGKTRLAARAAAEAREQFPGGVWLVDFARVTSAELVPGVVAAAMQITPATGEDSVAAIAGAIGERTLIALDNCEHLVEPCADLSSTLLERCPSLVVLATSREPLSTPGEIAWRVPSLGASEAADLFVDRARRVRPQFALDDTTRDAVESICRRLDGIPLAIELAAARVRAMPPSAIDEALSDRFRLLIGGRRDLPRHRTLFASVDWSHDLLSPSEQAAFRRLAVFAGGFTLDAAEVVCGTDGLDRYDVLDLITQLADRSLLATTTDDAGDVRYRMLETIRQYAEDRLAASGDASATRDAHRDYFYAFANRRTPGAMHQWFDQMRTDYDNVAQAIGWAIESGDGSLGVDFVNAVSLAWEAWGRGIEPTHWITRALAAAPEKNSLARARALGSLAVNQFMLGDFSGGIANGTAALSMFEKLGVTDNSITWAAHYGVAMSLVMTGDLTGGREHFVAGVEGGGSLDRIPPQALAGMTLITVVSGDTRGGVILGREAVRRSRSAGYDPVLILSFLPLALATGRSGDIAAVRDIAAEALLINAEFDNDWTAALAHSLAIYRGVLDGDVSELEAHRAAIWALMDAGGIRGLEGGFILTVGLSYAGEGDVERGIALMREAIDVYSRTGQSLITAMPLAFLGHYEMMHGELVAARRSFEKGLALSESMADRHNRALCRRGLAVLDRPDGDLAACAATLLDALEQLHEIGSWLDVPHTLDEVAQTLALAGEGRAAVRLAAAAFGNRARMGFAFDGNKPTPTEATPEVRNAIDPTEFDAVWNDGYALTIEDAVAFALRGTGTRLRPSVGWHALTPVELNVARLVAEGLDNPSIAARLFISRNTVKTHLQHIYGKLGMSRRAELAAEVVRRERSAD